MGKERNAEMGVCEEKGLLGFQIIVESPDGAG